MIKTIEFFVQNGYLVTLTDSSLFVKIEMVS